MAKEKEEVKIFAYGFKPNWSKMGNPKALEEYIGRGFVFNGPGKYEVYRNAVIIIIPADRTIDKIWNKGYAQDEVFVLHYYDEDPRDLFNALTIVPTREEF